MPKKVPEKTAPNAKNTLEKTAYYVIMSLKGGVFRCLEEKHMIYCWIGRRISQINIQLCSKEPDELAN